MTLTRAFLSLFSDLWGGGGNCPHSPSPLGTALSFFQQIFTRRVDNSKAIKAIATKIDSWLDLCKLIVFLPYVVTSQRYHIYVKLIFFSIFLRKVTTQNHNRAIAIEGNLYLVSSFKNDHFPSLALSSGYRLCDGNRKSS